MKLLPWLERFMTRWLPFGIADGAFAALVGGTALGQAMVLASTPLIARLYTQTEIGQFGLFLSFMSVAVVVVTARYELAIPSAQSDDEASTILLLTLRLLLPASLLGAGSFSLLIKWNLLSFGVLSPWTVIAIVPALILLGAFGALRYWFVREHRFRQLGSVLVSQGAARAVVPVVLGLLHAGSFGLIAGEIVGRGLGVGRMIRTANAALRVARQKPWSLVRAVAGKHWKYPGILLPSGLLDVFALALPIPLISQQYGVAAAGTFLLVQRLTAVPAALVGTSVGDIFHAGMADAISGDPILAKRMVDRSALRLLKFGAMVFLPAGVIAPFALPPLLGPQWKDSGLLFAAVAPWSLASLVVTPLSRVLAITERKELKLVYDTSALTLLVGVILVSSRLGFGLILTVASTSVGQVLAYLLYFLLIRTACDSSAFAPAGANQ